MCRRESGTTAELLQQGRVLQGRGDGAGAEAVYRRALQGDLRNAEAALLLGTLLGSGGRTAEAAELLAAAISADPALADAHAGLGNIHLLDGDFAAARRCYAQALALAPDHAAAHFNLGFLAQCELDHASAVRHYERARALALAPAPALPGLVKNLTAALLECGQFDRAEAELRELCLSRGGDFEVMAAMGQVLRMTHRPQEALDYLERARQLNAADHDLLLNLGIAQRDLGRIDAALDSFAAALALKPGSEQALWQQSLTCLLRQDYARGWENYDLRLRSKDLPPRKTAFPVWGNQSPAALNIRVYGEQGLGDEIMFASCLPDLIARGARCTIECSPKLAGILQRSFPAATVLDAASPAASVPLADVEVVLGSLPQRFRRRIEDFPQHHGYLQADPVRVAEWRQRLAATGPKLKVGLAWHGGSFKSRRPVRSIPLATLTPLLGVSGIDFVDLQYTDCSDEIEAVEAATGAKLLRWPAAREDYEDTAALVTALDLVISVCTAVIHLGGALGRAVWVMAPYSPEWRYGISGTGMPWYPSVRLFRQPAYGAWSPVIEDVAQSLRHWRDNAAIAAGRSTAEKAQQS